MTISKTRLMYILALVVAMSVLAWDKLFSNHDVSNTASPDNSVSPANGSVAPTPRPQHQFPIPSMPSAQTMASPSDIHRSPSLAERLVGGFLNSSAMNSDARDLFIPGRLFDPPPTEKATVKPNPPSLLLQSILIQPDASRALINGRIIAEGDYLDGVTILEIRSNNVRVDFAGQVITVMLDRTPSPEPQKSSPAEKTAKSPEPIADLDSSVKDL